jgi:hypothetical protein
METLLYTFLVQEGALFNYLEICTSIQHVCTSFSPNRFFQWFAWHKTKQGSLYWKEISVKWVKFYAYRTGT